MKSALLSRRVVQWTSGGVAVTCDGNSLTAASYPTRLAALAPLTSAAAPVANIGISGQTAADMLANRADVSAAWVTGRTNILIVWELTNSIYFGRTPAQAVQDLLDYIAAVKTDRAWRVVVVTTIPRWQPKSGDSLSGQAAADVYNADLLAANALLTNRWREQAHHLIDLRVPGSPFALANYQAATFDAAGVYASTADRVHCNDVGYQAVAQMVAAGLRRMPA